ncbi:MAG: Stk1 family PASTA domain-containing Ser/Thr kinase [Acidimicrobiales bacterium]|nr:Stk1 family PASTA domain-containing Ser/Thr kinase [Acidimicrobiales bacterium]
MADRPAPIFGGRYQLRRKIARGGMAEVFLAHDRMLDRPVALKVLFPELSTDPNFVERFRREAQAAANLSHPNIVSIYDWGEEQGTYYIVMELVDGRPLSTLRKTEGPLLADRAADIGAAVASALAFAHKHGVVHRDVKPGNVLLDGAGAIKVTDFGIARAMESADDNLTQTGAVMGTATYFSPEQAQGFEVDARSDIYSLGVMLYEMVCGKTPFSGSNPVAVATKHVRDLPPRPTSINPNLSPAFESIILTCLAKEPDDRYASSEDLRADLMRFRQGRAVAALPFEELYADDPSATMAVPRTTQATRAYKATQDATTVQRAVPGAVPLDVRRRTGFYVVLLFTLLALLGGLLYLLAKEVGIIGEGTSEKVAMINVVTDDRATAEAKIKEIGLTPIVVEENNSADAEIVFAQDPPPGTPVDKGAEVTIRVSKGLEKVKVPSVVGKAEATARDTLEELGFTVVVDHQPSDDVAKGLVSKQTPAANSELDSGASVTITVSSGEEGVAVPNVVGKTEDDAADLLNNAGFKVKRVKANSANVDKGDVISQDPAGGSDAAKGDTITITVSDGPESAEVPDVVGKTEAAAKAALIDAGFKVNVVEEETVDLTDDGTVIDQSPNGGATAQKGSTVTITVAT